MDPELAILAGLIYRNIITRGESMVLRTNRIVPSVTDAGPMTATAGTLGDLVWNLSNTKLYFCTVSHATAATWKEVTLV